MGVAAMAAGRVAVAMAVARAAVAMAVGMEVAREVVGRAVVVMATVATAIMSDHERS